MKIKLILLIISLVLLSGCGSLKLKTNEVLKSSEKSEEKIIKKEIKTSSSEEIAEFNKYEDKEYKISEGDIIGIVNTYKTIENGEYIVNIGGDINIEKIGSVTAAGKTIKEVEKEINVKLNEFYKNEKAVLNLKKINNNFSILGDIKTPGLVAIEGKISLIEAIAKSGGVSSEKNVGNYYARVMRENGKSIIVDIKEILYTGDIEKNVNLKKGDTIYVFADREGEKNNKIYVFGDVARAGEFEYNENLNLLEAIIKAGGPTKYGKMEKVFVIRTDSEERVKVYGCELEKILNTKESKMVYLQKKDIVFIGKSMVGNINGAIESILPSLMLTNSVLAPINSINELSGN